ncbi:MAG: hypothetical protein M1834_009527 [Cirrosporium novae-zelandiae]|nr:MAG: hypothetical protein M1834_009527 [Cirrosporium novae-zelandiae]
MEAIRTLLVANRGEIAVRIIKTAKALGIRTIAIYTEADAASTHVALADEAVLLAGENGSGYIDGDHIVQIAKKYDANAVIPGYGFLSEHAEFSQAVHAAGMVFVGPSAESIEAFGIKHTARGLAEKAGVPVVPGSGLVKDQEEALRISNELGFPIILKATAGGGGMGLMQCSNEEEVKKSFDMVQSRGTTLFKNAGVFIERFYPSSHHIEVQVFGNGLGKAISFGERECSIQRRHQKVIEECPSPFVTKHPELRDKLCSAAIKLAESIKYGSAGTVEYLVDDESGDFFFLEMNTRLQVEHGITELCYNVDMVELMLKQADAQLLGRGGLDSANLEALITTKPNGFAIEARLYAENPAKNYAPSPGTLALVKWQETDGSRIDTWVHTGSQITSYYDPLLAKVMFHSKTSRQDAICGMLEVLKGSEVCGPPTNLDFLASILQTPEFMSGKTLTKFLSSFKYSPSAIDVLAGGALTQIQDWPGRPTLGKGFPHSGPMDPLAFRIANLLVGNPMGMEALEITLNGPDLVFLGPAIISLCGAPMEAELDANPFKMWTRTKVEAGQRLKIGKTIGGGCRAYLAIYGGFPGIASWFGSKSTSTMVGVGGLQGRALATGDLLTITQDLPKDVGDASLPENLIPEYPNHWEILAMSGPYDDDFLTTEDVQAIFNNTWTISHNAARGGIRLLGDIKPKWARSDGGEGGAHPSNVPEYGYSIGALNWTGDDPVIFPVDCPDFGGFVSCPTIVKGEFWRLGQVKAGDTLKYREVSLADALVVRATVEKYIDGVAKCCLRNTGWNEVLRLDYNELISSTSSKGAKKGVIRKLEATEARPVVSYRQGGDDFLQVEYGVGMFDLNHTCRATALNKTLKESKGPISFSTGITNTVVCGNSITFHYDGTKIPQATLLEELCKLEDVLGDLHSIKFPSRLFRLPLTLESWRQTAAIQRYMETQRPYASYLPDNMDFVAKNNGFTRQDLEKIYFEQRFITIAVGFFCALPLCLSVDPRFRLNCPKMNPSRVWTPSGQWSWGGSCGALYNVESPGGYQLTGLTIPSVDILGYKKGYSPDRPWLFEDFDQLSFYPVSEEEYERQRALFYSGRYEYDWKPVMFDMKEHNKLLKETRAEVEETRKRQRLAQEEMDKLEKEMLEKWNQEKAKDEIPMDEVEALLNGKCVLIIAMLHPTNSCTDPAIAKIESPLNANVWKVMVEEGHTLEADETVVILEAMKLEISVRADAGLAGAKVEKLLVRPNDVVKGGGSLLLVRKKG